MGKLTFPGRFKSCLLSVCGWWHVLAVLGSIHLAVSCSLRVLSLTVCTLVLHTLFTESGSLSSSHLPEDGWRLFVCSSGATLPFTYISESAWSLPYWYPLNFACHGVLIQDGESWLGCQHCNIEFSSPLHMRDEILHVLISSLMSLNKSWLFFSLRRQMSLILDLVVDGIKDGSF